MKSDKSKKSKKGRIVVLALLLALAVPLAGLGLFFNHYFNKMVTEETTLLVNPAIEDITLPEEYTDSDADIEENIKDNRLWYNDDIINILLCGVDYGSEKKHYPRSDSMIILSLNRINKAINLVSLSRAAYVAIPGHKNSRLNHAYEYGGPNLLIQTIEQNYKIRIDNYITVDFDSFSKIVDTIGGVDIYMTNAELNYLKGLFRAQGIDISKGAGTYHLNGELALGYARTRKIDADRNRTQRQRNVLVQIIKKARNMSISKGLELADVFLPMVSTDLTRTQIVKHAARGINYARWPVYQNIIPMNEHLASFPMIKVNEQEVILMDWDVAKTDLHGLLYPGLEPQEPLE